MQINRVAFLIGSLILALCLTGGATHSQEVEGKPEISTTRLLSTMRFLGTAEMSFRGYNNRLANQQELLAFIRERNLLAKSSLDLESPSPYNVQITISPDATHYQISIRPDFKDESTSCSTAAFSDDSGVIFLGRAIGCPAEPR